MNKTATKLSTQARVSAMMDTHCAAYRQVSHFTDESLASQSFTCSICGERVNGEYA